MKAMKAIASTLTDNLDIWTGAIVGKSSAGRGRSKKFSLYGIAKLRALILDLALRGKLVPQDASDEPASELLKHIAGEKKRLVKAVNLRKPREHVSNGKPKELFHIPSTWQWVRLDEVGAIVGGGTPPASDLDNFAEGGTGIAWVTPADLGGFSDLYISHGARDLSEKGLQFSSATVMPEGTVLFTSRAPIGYVAIAANQISTNQGFKSIVPYVLESSRYVAIVMKAFAPEINAQAPGTTFKEVSGKIVAAISFPLPPLAEQRRIVAKVDELMVLCDALEASTYEAIEAHELLVEKLLVTLTNSRDNKDFTENWARIETHFDALFTTEASIDRLRRTILQLAMMGKLVPQDQKDEPATALLARINKEIVAYARTQGIRATQPDPIDGKKLQSPSPVGWRWTRLCTLFKVITDGDHQPPPKANDGVAFLTIGNITTGKLDFEGCRLVPETYFQSLPPYRTPAKGDILYTVVGATYGRVAVVETDRDFCVQRHIAILKPVENIDLRFIAWLLTSPLVYEQASQSTTGTAQPTIALRPLRNFIVPLPPLAEQKRIVAKLSQLTGLCDELKARVVQADRARVQFADALASRAVV